jgi:Asp/Glu/hydantoin racemase
MSWGLGFTPIGLAALTVANALACAAHAQTSDTLLSSALENCDRQAHEQAAQATGRKSIAPSDVLAWPLLLNDLAIRRQQETNEPRLLAEIEQQRQQCHLTAENAAAQRIQEAHKQEQEKKEGYQRISVEAFALDGKDLARKSAKVSISGVYLGSDSSSFLFSDARSVILATRYPNLGDQPKVPLLIDNATREFRKRLLDCRSNPASTQVGCPVIVLGRAAMCTLRSELGVTREMPCIDAQDGR